MKRFLRRLRGAFGMGLSWAVVGFAAGGVIELIHNIWPNPIGGAVDIWPAVLAYPGLLGGIAFSAVLGVVGRHRRFDQLSLPLFAAVGAVGGILVSLVPVGAVALGIASVSGGVLKLTLSLAVPFALGGATAASGTLWIARMAEDRELLQDGSGVGEVGLTSVERRELLD